MSPNALWSRRGHRLLHLLLASALGTYLYSPLGDVGAAQLAVQVVLFPALALSGLLLWQAPRLRRWFRQESSAA